ncbi:MAG: hypothetical protein AAF960_18190 [Bacteroidota bacterium]
MRIDFFWKNTAGDTIRSVSSTTLEEITYLFDIEAWSYEITPADTLNGYYLAQVAIGEAACGPRVELPIVADSVEEEEEKELPIELPLFECGDEYVEDSLASTNPLEAASTGDIFLIGGFPVLVETLAPFTAGTGYFSGTGVIPLPFKKTVVEVEFNNIFVTDEYRVTEGTVYAKSDDPANYPDFSVAIDTISVGGDICLPPPPPPGYTADGINKATGLDDWGFNVEGIHQNGTMYDDSGYDKDGIHKDTNTAYNSQGCSREGTDEEGNVCDPNAGENPAAIAFADSIAGDLAPMIDSLLGDLMAELQDSLDQLDCEAIRMEMKSLVNTLAYDPLFIFGVGDKYLEEGMHQEFAQEPLPLEATVERRAEAQELEEKHVDLYHCDKNAAALNELLTKVAAMRSDDALATSLLETIKNWTEYAYGLHTKDATAFITWLSNQLNNTLQAPSDIDGLTAIKHSDKFPFLRQLPSSPKQLLEQHLGRYAANTTTNYPTSNQHTLASLIQYDRGLSGHNTLATNGDFLFDEGFTLEDASFEFRQGAQWINGINRGYYLEGIARQQYFNPTEANANLQPIKVSKTAGNQTVTIYLDQMAFTPDGAVLDAYAIIEDPETGRRLMFRGLGISFGPTGLAQESSLSLGTDIEIRLNNATLLIIKGTEGTNLTWDCDGFQSVSIDAAIELCREYIIPLNPGTLEPLPDPERYRIDFAFEKISSWLDFTFEVGSPRPFAVAGAEDIKWQLDQIVLDFSSESTPEFDPIEGYASPFFDKRSGMEPGWKGFYMKTLSATFPNDFSSSSEAIKAKAEDILIDECGFSGGFSAKNLISIADGDVGGWPFSIDQFELSILKNGFGGAGLGGKINVPLFKENMDYTAIMYPNSQYKFTVSPIADLTADVFLAKVTLYEDSKIEVGKVDGAFRTLATMSGNISVNADSTEQKGAKFSFPQLSFEGFQVSNQAPYFSPGKWGITVSGNNGANAGVGASFAGFKVSVSNIRPYSPNDKEVGLGFNANISLVKALEITALGRLGIEGELLETNGRQKWVYKDLNVSGVGINASFPGAAVAGFLEWYKGDNTWGKGFRGVLEAKFKGFEGFGLQAAAQFGSVDDYKYFFVDALADLGTGIGTGALQLKGFGGGISYHMDAQQNEVNYFNTSGAFTLPTIGHSFSGTEYMPNKTIGLGLKAAVLVATAKDEVFNGAASLQFLFNKGNGLKEISLQGSGQFLVPLDLIIPPLPEFIPNASSAPTSVNASLAAYLNIKVNFSKPSFDGSLNVFLNTPGGIIRGDGTGGHLVNAQLYFAPEKWYIRMGRPYDNQMAGLLVDIPGLGSLGAKGYFQVGTDTDPMRKIPSNVSEIAYKINRNESLRRSGSGLVMGASKYLKLDAEIAKIVKATLEAEAGYDIMLRKYEGVSCAETGGPIGINGWYAVGQMYAYASGKLKVFGVNIAEAGIAAVLQARLPNPFLAQATVGVKVKVGPLKAKKSLKLKLGTDCNLVVDDDSDLGMQVITYLTPSDQEANVATNAQPEAFLALSLNKPYEIAGLNGTHQFRVELVETVLTSSSGSLIGHYSVPSEDGTSVKAIPHNTFTANDSVTFAITVQVFKEGEPFVLETKSVTFATGDFLGYIPEINVKAAYPANGMVNFYRNEYQKQEGYIELVTGQSELFNDLPEGAAQFIRLTSANGAVQTVDFTYSKGANKLTFPLNGSQLQAGELYQLEVVQVGGASVANATSADTPPSTDQNAAVATETEGVLYQLFFRVSNHATFGEKMDAMVRTSSSERGIVHTLPELLDAMETDGNTKYDALVAFETDVAHDWVYQIEEHLKSLEILISCSRDYPSITDLSQSVRISRAKGATSVSQNDFSAGTFNASSQQNVILELEKLVGQFARIREDLLLECGGGSTGSLTADCIGADGSSADCENFLGEAEATYNALPSGSRVRVFVSYSLPGGIETTTKELTFIR